MPLPERLDAEFLTSAPNIGHCPQAAGPEIAFAGRSNSGKSSVLNKITGNKRMAKVSKAPGRTQLLNFFDLRVGGRLVDLPGYGYAKASKQAQTTWQLSVNEYLSERDCLAGLVLVMDIRHPNQDFDQELLNWAHQSELPVRVLLNKADKLSYSAQQTAIHQFNKRYTEFSLQSTQTFSALRGHGKSELIEQLLIWINAPHPS